nr:hormone-sensitive lipase-like [Taeniopygia guttata]XP_041568364.1 hormone-sensitive lipase-like [Taeniopygia guttata]
MLDDSVALARRLRALGRPVTLRVVPGVPHGFLSLAPLSPECRRAGGLRPGPDAGRFGGPGPAFTSPGPARDPSGGPGGPARVPQPRPPEPRVPPGRGPAPWTRCWTIRWPWPGVYEPWAGP